MVFLVYGHQSQFSQEMVKTMGGQHLGLLHLKLEKLKKSEQRINLPGWIHILREDRTRVAVNMRIEFSMIIMDATIRGLQNEGLGLNIAK
jgi:ascorbate-specific PTS system EIIC-type component UlaA